MVMMTWRREKNGGSCKVVCTFSSPSLWDSIISIPSLLVWSGVGSLGRPSIMKSRETSGWLCWPKSNKSSSTAGNWASVHFRLAHTWNCVWSIKYKVRHWKWALIALSCCFISCSYLLGRVEVSLSKALNTKLLWAPNHGSLLTLTHLH